MNKVKKKIINLYIEINKLIEYNTLTGIDDR